MTRATLRPARRVAEILPSVVHTIAAQGLRRIDDCDPVDRGDMRVTIAESMVREIFHAYREQQKSMANYKLTIDDVLFSRRWLAWHRCRAVTEAWEAQPGHASARAVLAAHVAGGHHPSTLPQAVLDVLATVPAQVEPVTLASAPDGWPRSILSWSEALEQIIASRWGRA